ncbi:hypothetical protein KAR91_78640 [Candidatus Pacearchaeota archaeon]|nr:hypothetical protein [Candidatus Pacearchaeota archaeon]
MKVTPRTKEKRQVDFETLKSGDTFHWHGAVWIKINYNQGAVNLETGKFFTENCGEYIVPINATMTWKYKEAKKKK